MATLLIRQQDGSKLQWSNCTFASALMAIVHDGGPRDIKPGELRAYSYDQAGGTSLKAVMDAVRKHPRLGPGWVLPIYSEFSGTLDTTGQQVLEWLARGYGVVFQHNYALLEPDLACQASQGFLHASYAEGVRIIEGETCVGVYDPICWAVRWYPLEEFFEVCYAYAGTGQMSVARTRMATAPEVAPDMSIALNASSLMLHSNYVVEAAARPVKVYRTTDRQNPVDYPAGQRFDYMGLAAEPGWYAVRIKTDNWNDDGLARWKVGFLPRTDGTHRVKTKEELLATAKDYAAVGTDTSALEAQIEELTTALATARQAVQVRDGRIRNLKTKAANYAADIADD
jgi:hypothetical protein